MRKLAEYCGLSMVAPSATTLASDSGTPVPWCVGSSRKRAVEVARSASMVSHVVGIVIVGELDALALRWASERRRSVIAVEDQLVRLVEFPQRDGRGDPRVE